MSKHAVSPGGRWSVSTARTLVCSGRLSVACATAPGCGGAASSGGAHALAPPDAQRSDTVARSPDSTSRRISARVNPDRPSGPDRCVKFYFSTVSP